MMVLLVVIYILQVVFMIIFHKQFSTTKYMTNTDLNFISVLSTNILGNITHSQIMSVANKYGALAYWYSEQNTNMLMQVVFMII